uniref:ARAD1D16610p n=1 Tax=Blastobotrys adeninivorans TaxID=409370 RepID=A0A060T9P7_BLAAD
MGKSLRAKQKVRFRGIKREKVFGPAEHARAIRLAQKIGSKVNEKAEDKMETDETEQTEENKPKVSTSGWKGSRNDGYKKKKTNKALLFKKKKK